MKWVKAAAVGALGSLVMFLLMMVGIHGTGIAPFNIPPSAAFLERLGFNIPPLPLLVHFGYGMAWSLWLVAYAGPDTTLTKGLTLAVGLWTFMMLVYSPIIGWGVFGFGGTGPTLAPDNPLYLGSSVAYLGITLVVHLVYGTIIGTLNPAWMDTRTPEQASA